MNLTVVAVANGEPRESYLQRGFHAFKDSCARFDIQPLILGWGAPWRGLGSKPKLLKAAMEAETINTEFLIFADAYDTCFTQDPRKGVEMLKKAREATRDILHIIWNGERNCFPRAEWADHHPPSDWPWRYFNSGLSIGATEAYYAMLSQIGLEKRPDDHRKADGSWHHENDQDFLMDKFLHGQCGPDEPRMFVDTGCNWFQTMIGETMEGFDLIEVEGQPLVRNNRTGTSPIAFHWNGPAKSNGTMEPILNHLKL